jgi:putative transposase
MRPEQLCRIDMSQEMSSLPIRKNIRLKHYDYSTNGYYFVTICTHTHKSLLSRNENVIEDIIKSLPLKFPGVNIDYYVLMPSHVHIIFVLQESKISLPEVVRTFKALATKNTGMKRLWQRGYYEHVIRNDRALYKIREYIQNNPLAEILKFNQFYTEKQMPNKRA